MALTMSEQRRLAEIERHLSAEDPGLARMIADSSVGPSRRCVPELVTGVIVFVAVLLVGAALVGALAGTVLIVLGVLGLLATITLVIRVLWPGWRPSEEQDAKPSGEPRPRPDTELWYVCCAWWWV